MVLMQRTKIACQIRLGDVCVVHGFLTKICFQLSQKTWRHGTHFWGKQFFAKK
jgi:hypothetical protein